MLGVHHLLDEVRLGLNIQDLLSLIINYSFTKWNGTIIWQLYYTTSEHKKFSYEHAHTPKPTKTPEQRETSLMEVTFSVFDWISKITRLCASVCCLLCLCVTVQYVRLFHIAQTQMFFICISYEGTFTNVIPKARYVQFINIVLHANGRKIKSLQYNKQSSEV